MTEQELIQKFLEAPPLRFKYHEREVSLALPLPLKEMPEGANPWHEAISTVFNRISIDLVLHAEDKVYLCEAKTVLNRASIGDALTAKVIWDEVKGKEKESIPVIICGRGKHILGFVCKKLGIMVFELKESTTSKELSPQVKEKQLPPH